MYHSRPFINNDISINIPNCIYKMKNIISNNFILGEKKSSVDDNLDISQQNEISLEMSILEDQQKKILGQLDELKDQMFNLKNILNIPNESCKMHINVDLKDETEFYDKNQKSYDFVINVNPLNPPYSLLILKKIWANSIKIIVKSYIHSTVVDLPEIAEEFLHNLNNLKPNTASSCIFIRLIWKNVTEKMELITSSTMPLQGEINFLRYLSRIGFKKFNYELLKNVSEIDSVLDICYLLGKARTKTERHALLQALNVKLGKSEWLCNENISIADIAACSTIKQVLNVNDLNVNLSKWMHRCENF